MINRILFLLFAATVFFFAACTPPAAEDCDCEERVPKLMTQVTGAEATLQQGTQAGLALDALPGVQQITTEELLKMEEPPETGLFLVDTDFVPQELPEQLKEEGYRLSPDGTLDSAGVKIALYVQAAVYKLSKPNKATDDLNANQPTARAFPQPWAGYSYSFSWKYNGGFCRKYEARTRAHTYGPPTGGFWPYTNVQWIQTYAAVGSSGDSDYCSNCFTEYSKDTWNIGCFWPAHGGASGYHYLYIYDSGASVFVNWSW